MQDMNVMIQDYHFYKNIGFSEDKIKQILNVKQDSVGKDYLYLEKRKKSPLSGLTEYNLATIDKSKLLFSVRYNLP